MYQLLIRVFVLIIFILVLPFFFFLFILVKLTSKGPFLFKQKRLGKDKKIFTIYKIRTMINNAEKLKGKYLSLNEVDGPVFKIKNDPRYTKIGKILALYGIDELPQLINILKGEMSLVGPRPLPVVEAKAVPEKYHERFSVKPGITSPWVIKGLHKLTFNQWMKLDLDYVKKKSLIYDIQILLITVKLILSKLFKSVL